MRHEENRSVIWDAPAMERSLVALLCFSEAHAVQEI